MQCGNIGSDDGGRTTARALACAGDRRRRPVRLCVDIREAGRHRVGGAHRGRAGRCPGPTRHRYDGLSGGPRHAAATLHGVADRDQKKFEDDLLAARDQQQRMVGTVPSASTDDKKNSKNPNKKETKRQPLPRLPSEPGYIQPASSRTIY
jgi:hypothetical protein